MPTPSLTPAQAPASRRRFPVSWLELALFLVALVVVQAIAWPLQQPAPEALARWQRDLQAQPVADPAALLRRSLPDVEEGATDPAALPGDQRPPTNARRAARSLAIVEHLPSLLAAHWLLTLAGTALARMVLTPLARLNALAIAGLLFAAVCARLGALPSPWEGGRVPAALAVWLTASWILHHFFAHRLPPARGGSPKIASAAPGWWLFTATGWLLLLDQSLHFHERLRFVAMDHWVAWCIAAVLLPLAAWAAPVLLGALRWLSAWLWMRARLPGQALRIAAGGALVLALAAVHRAGVPQHVTGEVLKLLAVIALCGWCLWRMPVAAQLWHAGLARSALPGLAGSLVVMALSAAAAFLTADKGPLLVLALLAVVLLAAVMGWTTGFGLLLIGILLIFFIGIDLDVVGERVQAWRDPFSAGRDDMARLLWFQAESGARGWGFGIGQVPWCGTARTGACAGLPLQLQSDYTFTALVGWWGPVGAWGVLVLFSAWLYRWILHAARRAPVRMRPEALLAPGGDLDLVSLHLQFLVAVLLLVQAWITVAGNLNWLPLTGVTWPLMSYGRTSLWISTALAGMLALRDEHV